MTPPTTDAPSTIIPVPELPAPEDVPRESPVDAEIMAATMLDKVRRWAPLAIQAGDFYGAAAVRGKVSPITGSLYRRKLSKTSILDAQEAHRITDRVLAITIRAGQEAGLIRLQGDSRSRKVSVDKLVGGRDRAGIYRYGEVTLEEFEAALRKARAAGSLSQESVVGYLGLGTLTEAQEKQRARIEELASEGYTSRQIGSDLDIAPSRVTALARRYGLVIHGDVVSRRTHRLDPARIISEIIPIVDGAGSSADQLDAGDISKIDPEQAKEWARQLGRALAPVAALQRSLRDRGRE
jgi:hypothetical protein